MPPPPRPPPAAPPVPVGDDVHELLRETFLALKRRQRVVLRSQELSHTEWIALHLCSQGPARGQEIAEMGDLTPAGATDVVDRLEGRGLVRRARDPDDRRAMRVELTDDGRRLHAETRRRVVALWGEMTGSLAPGEYRALSEGLRALLRAERAHPEPA